MMSTASSVGVVAGNAGSSDAMPPASGPSSSSSSSSSQQPQPPQQHDEYEYLNLVRRVIERGKVKSDRTGASHKRV